MTTRDLIGRRVHIWQPVPVTSSAHYTARLAAVTGPQGGLPRLHLIDVEVTRGGTTRHLPDRTMDWSLNWAIEDA